MNIIGVIPARFHSSRFKGKILADILGKPMIQHVWERARQSLLLEDLIIACDEQKVADCAKAFGAKVVLTSKGHISGTDRICEVINPLDVRVVINIQADEPLVQPMMIDRVAQELLDDEKLSVVSLMKKIEDPHQINDPNVVKVVVDKDNFALYFSRSAIPHHAKNSEVKSADYYKHIGLYGYAKDFLFTYKNLPVCELEKIERLEQLRILREGFRIKLIETKYDTIGVDRPEDLEKVKQYLINLKRE